MHTNMKVSSDNIFEKVCKMFFWMKKSCKPTFIHADFILRFPEAKLSLFQTLVIRIKWQGLVRVKKYSLSQTSWKILAHE